MTQNGVHNMTKTIAKLLIPGFLFLAGCSTNVTITGNYPTPLCDPLPIKAGLFFNEAFKTYTFSDTSGRRDVTMEFGPAQTKLFTTISTCVFQESQVLTAMPGEGGSAGENGTANFDLVLVPNVEEVQIALPYDTSLNVYEVWIKYNLQIFDANGNAIADWIMTSYGKTPTRSMTSAEKALNLASNVALRDAGARITLGFGKIPEVENLLASRLRQNRQATGNRQESTL